MGIQEGPVAAPSADQQARQVEALIIGAGFGGLCMGIKLKESGVNDFVILEKEQDVGGTWLVNSYPGCACDVQSHLYSYSFEPNPEWSRMFSPQPEIWNYLRRCADKYGLRAHIRFGVEAGPARFDEATGRWTLRTLSGEIYSARILVSAMGGLSRPAAPALKGLDNFRGKTFHSQQWDHGYDLKGKRVAVIGTGASAIQFVPEIAPLVAQLDLYQRTPPWILPKPDYAVSGAAKKLFRWFPPAQTALRGLLYALMESRVLGFEFHQRFMNLPKQWALKHIARQIKDPVLRKKVTPDYTIGCKRILMSNNYYPALAQPTTELITEGIREVREKSIVTDDGRERPVDAIIYGTGFQVQSPLPRGMLFGADGRDITEQWVDGPEAYKGVNVAGFPNLFILLGPNTGLGHNSIIYMIESQVHYVMQMLKLMREKKLRHFSVKPAAQQRFNDKVQARLQRTVWNSGGCKSWYLSESGRNFTLWPGFTFRYRKLTRELRLQDYELVA